MPRPRCTELRRPTHPSSAARSRKATWPSALWLRPPRSCASCVFPHRHGRAEARARRVPARPRARPRWMRPFVHGVLFWRDLSAPRAVRLRLALEDLGPIFVKFGQMLSTRRDLLPDGHRRRAREAAGPRAAVPDEQVIATLERGLRQADRRGVPRFDRRRSRARRSRRCISRELPDGTPVAVKVLRPEHRTT